MHRLRIRSLSLAGLLVATAAFAHAAEPSDRVIAFYYGWYANPATDGAYHNWNHPVADKSGRQFPGGNDIGANFYPAAGCYSANDPKTLDRQMNELRSAGVGILCASWWGKGTPTDKVLPRLLDAAARHGLKVNLHVEPFPGRNAAATRDAIVYILDNYGAHPGLQRSPEFGRRPVFFVYDSYLTPAKEWASILEPGRTNTLRGTRYDAAVIGLWVKEHDGEFMTAGHFDGFYTYFAADGFTYGSTAANWPRLAEFARGAGKTFIPSVGPGYIDTRIRPWNGRTTRDREGGQYYDRLFRAALDCDAPMISITSYNEWHEGTQIEPAAPKQIPGFTYLDYAPLASDDYLKRTAFWVEEFKKRSPKR